MWISARAVFHAAWVSQAHDTSALWFPGSGKLAVLASRIFKFLVRADETETDTGVLEAQLFDILSF